MAIQGFSLDLMCLDQNINAVVNSLRGVRIDTGAIAGQTLRDTKTPSDTERMFSTDTETVSQLLIPP